MIKKSLAVLSLAAATGLGVVSCGGVPESSSADAPYLDQSRQCMMYSPGWEANPNDTGAPLVPTCSDSPVPASWVDPDLQCAMYPVDWSNETDPRANQTSSYPVCTTSPRHPEYEGW